MAPITPIKDPAQTYLDAFKTINDTGMSIKPTEYPNPTGAATPFVTPYTASGLPYRPNVQPPVTPAATNINTPISQVYGGQTAGTTPVLAPGETNYAEDKAAYDAAKARIAAGTAGGTVDYGGADTTAALQAKIDALQNSAMTPDDMAFARAQFQAQIDALNSAYAEEKAKLATVQQGRVGSDIAIQGRRGLLGSDFGTAQAAGVQEANMAESRAAQAQHNLNLANVYEKVSKAAKEEAARRTDAATKGADAKIEEISSRQTRRKNAVASIAQSIIDAGIDPNNLTEEEINKFAVDSKTLNISKDDLINALRPLQSAKLSAEASAQTGAEKSAAELAKTKAETSKIMSDTNKPFTVGSSKYQSDGKGGFTYLGSTKEGSGTGTDETADIKKFQSDAAAIIPKLDAQEISWGAAFDSLKAKYPNASNDTINSILGGSIPYNPETGEFDYAKAKGRALPRV